MKKIVALTLALFMLIAVFAACSKKKESDAEGVDMTVTDNERVYRAEGDYSDAFYYDYINIDEISIIGYSGSHLQHAIAIPDSIEGLSVTEVADSAFKSKTNITAVTLPATVRRIGDMAFYGCNALESVNMPAALTEIGVAAFADCIVLGKTGLTVPATVTAIGADAFYDCKSLSALTLPEAITELPARICYKCERLKAVAWSASGTKIGDSAFMGCALLDTINFPATLTDIGAYAFADCSRMSDPHLAGVTVGENAFYITPAA